MDIQQKLIQLLPHWVEHNTAHAQSYRQWADQASGAGMTKVAKGIEDAIAAVEEANKALERAMEPLGEGDS